MNFLGNVLTVFFLSGLKIEKSKVLFLSLYLENRQSDYAESCQNVEAMCEETKYAHLSGGDLPRRTYISAAQELGQPPTRPAQIKQREASCSVSSAWRPRGLCT